MANLTLKVSGTKVTAPKVYLLKARGFPWYKLGKSRRFTKRFRWIYTNLPFEVDLLHTIDADNIGAVEDHFKRLFKTKQVRGEWYDLSAEDVETFKGYTCPKPKAIDGQTAAMLRRLKINALDRAIYESPWTYNNPMNTL